MFLLIKILRLVMIYVGRYFFSILTNDGESIPFKSLSAIYASEIPAE